MGDSFRFPASDLDNAQVLLRQVGGFWSGIYAGNFLVESMLYARGQLAQQSHDDILHLAASLSRSRLPLLHTDNWYCLRLRASEKNRTVANLARHDGQFTYADGLVYDQPLDTRYHVWPLPAGLADVLVISNRITSPSLTWSRGVDFFLDNGAIWFRQDPFADERVGQREIYVDGRVQDREATLWLYRSGWDRDAVHTQYGYAVGLQLPSTPQALALVNAVFDCLVEGATERSLEAALSAICDVPLAEGDEVVELIFRDGRHQWVVTSRRAYSFHRDSTVLVRVGDWLAPGQPLTDTLRFFTFHRGQVPPEIKALAVGRGFLDEGYYQDVVFANKEVDLVVEDDGPETPTRVYFELGGYPADVERFWSMTHAAGVARGQTLAMLLDTRPPEARDMRPGPLALPRKVNALGFLLQNVFRNNLLVIQLRPRRQGPHHLGLGHVRVLRKLLPPHMAYILLMQLETDTDEIIMEGPGSEEAPGYSEEVRYFLGRTCEEEVAADTFLEEEVRLVRVGGHCI
jgi:hypothetical protein